MFLLLCSCLNLLKRKSGIADKTLIYFSIYFYHFQTSHIFHKHADLFIHFLINCHLFYFIHWFFLEKKIKKIYEMILFDLCLMRNEKNKRHLLFPYYKRIVFNENGIRNPRWKLQWISKIYYITIVFGFGKCDTRSFTGRCLSWVCWAWNRTR